MAKNGLPPVFSCTSCASGAARSDSQRSASAINCPTLLGSSGASAISATLPPAVRDRVELPHQRMARRRPRCPDRRRPAAGVARPPGSADPRAGRASPRPAIADRRGTAPADAPARANTPMKRRNTSWNRACACCGGKLRNRRLVADDELQFGDEVDHEPAVRAQRLEQARRASAPARRRSCRAAVASRL